MRSSRYDEYLDVVRTLADGFTTRRGHRAAYVHRDAVNGVLRGRRGARLTALTSGGAIPDTADYDVVLEPAGQLVGTVNEDFAVESLAGDVFQLGNTSYRIRRVEAGRVRVEDAQGQAPTIPFWLGEAPARSDELSHAVSRLRDGAVRAHRRRRRSTGARSRDSRSDPGIARRRGEQLVDYLAARDAALGALPTQDTIVLERFFDESGGMQLVIHAPFGSRINRAWGLALRKRFCVKFNFELQAAATEDAIVLSLSTSHSFELADVARYLHSNTRARRRSCRRCSQRRCSRRAGAGSPARRSRCRAFAAAGRSPAPLQRMRAEDLMASVFPDQIACAENLVGEREIPDHPLVRQAIHDCLYEAMDIEGLERLLRGSSRATSTIVARDLPAPSPLALEILNARPYAYLDDAPLEERRTQAVMGRRWLDEATAGDARPARRRGDRSRPRGSVARRRDRRRAARRAARSWIHRRGRGGAQSAAWPTLLATLAQAQRATRLTLSSDATGDRSAQRCDSRGLGRRRAAAAVRCVASSARCAIPPIDAPAEFAERSWDANEALVELLRSRLQGLGPVTAQCACRFDSHGRSPSVERALAQLAAEGVAMAGAFTPATLANEWCDRDAARAHSSLHRATGCGRRSSPSATQDFMRFLFRWQHVSPGEQRQGPDALDAIIAPAAGLRGARRRVGIRAAAGAARKLRVHVARRSVPVGPRGVDALDAAGAPGGVAGRANVIRTTPVTLLPRRSCGGVDARCTGCAMEPAQPSSRAQAVVDFLQRARRIVLR